MQNHELKKNNKGFTLVELIVCVAILLVVAAPLLRAFVTAANLEKKGRDMSAVSLTAQNIQEIIAASDMDSVVNGSCFAPLTSTATVVSEPENCDYAVNLENIITAGQRYDATVKLNAYKSTDVPVVTAMDAVFSQPTDAKSDPDKLSSASGGKRTITVDIKSEDGKTVTDVKVTYSYASGSSFIYDIYESKDKIYSSANEDRLNVYLMYQAWSGSESVIVNNAKDVPLNFFLVKQSNTAGNSGQTQTDTNQLEVRINQSKTYSRDEQTTTLYCNRTVTSYRVFCGTIWYFKGTAEKKLYVSKSGYGLYNTTIEIKAHNGTEVLYTLEASKRG